MTCAETVVTGAFSFVNGTWPSCVAVLLLEVSRVAVHSPRVDSGIFVLEALILLAGLVTVWRSLRSKNPAVIKTAPSSASLTAGMKEASKMTIAELSQPTTLPGDARLFLSNAAPCKPAGIVHTTNPEAPCEFDSGPCFGSWVLLARPTNDPAADAAGNYPYAEHLHGRRRLWEFRIQMTFRQHVAPGEIYFGCEQDRYYYINPIEKYVGSSVTSLLRRAATGMYQTHGDDPATTQGEPERPGVVFPLWVMDQLIITPENEKPPSVCDPDFSSMGMTKAHDRKAMKKAIDELVFEPGKTFTFGFWCVAQFVDAIGWKIPARGLLPETRLDALGTHPPCYIAVYGLRPREQWTSVQNHKDKRHLDSRKNYLFRVGLWSSIVPPTKDRIKALTERASTPTSRSRDTSGGPLRRKTTHTFFENMMSGCFSGLKKL